MGVSARLGPPMVSRSGALVGAALTWLAMEAYSAELLCISWYVLGQVRRWGAVAWHSDIRADLYVC